MVVSIGAFSLIGKPTRMTNTSQTFTDHILTNDTTNIIYPIIFLSEITDHYPVACVLTKLIYMNRKTSIVSNLSITDLWVISGKITLILIFKC